MFLLVSGCHVATGRPILNSVIFRGNNSIMRYRTALLFMYYSSTTYQFLDSCSDAPAHFIPHRFAFQCSDPCSLLYSLHKPFYVAVGFCPPWCDFPVLEPFFLWVFFKFMAVERWTVIRFDLLWHSICVKHPFEHRYGCLFASGSHESDHWVSGILTVEYEGEVSFSHRPSKIHADLIPRSLR